MRGRVFILAAVVSGLAIAWAANGASSAGVPVVVKEQGYLPFTAAPIEYRSENVDDPVARLNRELERGAVKLRYDARFGYLPAVLRVLRVPVSSQTLVFSKTSFQFPQITPETPRALYYNDDIYIGQVHNGRLLEFVSFDPNQGAIFYVMDQHRTDKPRFERSALDCVQCHVAASTRGIPGVMLRSVYTNPSGQQAPRTPAFITGQESDYKDRWGGWYVTGSAGVANHLGNALLPANAPPEQLDRRSDANLRDLTGRIDTSAYLTKYSDVVAHLVLAHQTQMHNLITLTSYQTRLAIDTAQKKAAASGSAPGELADAARRQIEKTAEDLVRYLLFANEAPMPGPVAGTSGFTEDFAARGPRDAKRRSLRDFDLRTRIFRYPCSYLIYSEAFDAIPKPAKDYIYRRLFEILTGRDRSSEYAGLSDENRRAILEILVATKPSLPDEWKEFVAQTTAMFTVAGARPAQSLTITSRKGITQNQ